MRIAMINGSPKLGKSTSGMMLEKMKTFINAEHETTFYNINKNPLNEDQYTEICHMDILLFAFPLFIDAIPSHLFRMIIELEQYLKKEKQENIYVYAIINNGFYEGHQNKVAIDIMKNWCYKAGINFGMAICTGAGEMVGSLENVPIGHGPLTNLGKAMDSLTDSIHKKSIEKSILFSPNFPKFAWKFMADSFWNSSGKKNKLKKKDIFKKIHSPIG